MVIDELKLKIKNDDISGFFLFLGKEDYMKDHYADLLRKNVERSPLPEFNHIYHSAVTGKLTDLEDAVFSLPYMWETKLIELTDLENAALSESDIESYERILSDIPDYLTVLAVVRDVSGDDNPDKTKKKSGLSAFASMAEKIGYVVDFMPEKSDKLANWVNKHFAREGVPYDANVSSEMINYCGTDMYILEGEIKKLCAAYNGVNPLTVNDVHKYCCENVAFKYFDLAAALNRRDMLSAKKIYDALDLKRADIPAALGYIIKTYSDMILVKTGVDSGRSFDNLAKDLKIPSWRIGKLAQSVSSINLRSLAFIINCLSDADMHIKSMGGDPKIILELAFYRICANGR